MVYNYFRLWCSLYKISLATKGRLHKFQKFSVFYVKCITINNLSHLTKTRFVLKRKFDDLKQVKNQSIF